MRLSERMRNGEEDGRPDITWSGSRVNTTIDRWTDDVEKLEARNEALKERDEKVTEHLRTFVSGLVTVEQMYLLANALLTEEQE